jgi:UDP-glucose 4-epimerase
MVATHVGKGALVASVVLVTGVSRYMGGIFVRELAADPSVERIIGVDVVPPPHPIGRAEFVRADIRNPMIGKIIGQADVDTVVHMNVIATPRSAGGRVSQKEINVIGTMQLLAACQKAPGLRRLVVKSSAAVYGSSPRDPAMFTEEMGPKSLPRAGFGKDSVEVEGYVRGFSRRRPDVGITTLRLANILGPGIRTSMTDYFALPVIPAPLGFDARLQFVHEHDASRALVLATTAPEALGTINIAGDGVITMQQAAAIVGRPLLPVPLAAAGLFGGMVKRVGLADFSDDQMQYLAYGRGLDTTRMREVLHFVPDHTTRQAFVSYAEHVSSLVPGAGTAAHAVQGVAGTAAQVLAHAFGGRVG